jgi:sulfate adenylyltransferase subunit 1 (EFTu-like GTPase family)
MGPVATGRKIATLRAVSARRGTFEWAFLLDALQTERDQGITIHTSQIRFRTKARDVVLIDAPGHAEFLRNMITGAAQADAAILIVDANEGIREQTRRHGYLLHLLGVRKSSWCSTRWTASTMMWHAIARSAPRFRDIVMSLASSRAR